MQILENIKLLEIRSTLLGQGKEYFDYFNFFLKTFDI